MDELNSLPNEVLSRIDALANKLGVSVEFIYTRLVEDNKMLGLVGIICGLGGAILCVATIYVLYRMAKMISSKIDRDIRPLPYVIATIVSIFLFIMSGCLISDGMDSAKKFAAPNKFAIEDIRALFSGDSLTDTRRGG